ncbi:MAG TPA: HTTM domain-containing protein [Myxococcaceae bacterium]|nr:HTTM domain-containing protein [Myxococcaceae bacterium]
MFQPVDAGSLTAFRILFGLLMMAAVARFFVHGWIAEYYLRPRFFFTYEGFRWVRPWSGWGMYLHFAAMGVAALGIATGRLYRISAAAFFALFTYAHLIDKTNYLNHYYLISLLALLLVLLPLRRGATTYPAWVLWTLRAQVGCVYLFGGIAKLKPDWLIHAQPLKIWLLANTDLPVIGPFLGMPGVPHLLSVAGALFDLGVVPALLWSRTRPLAYSALLGFHLLTGVLFQLGMFPWVMAASALLFFPPDWPSRVRQRLGRLKAGAAPRPGGPFSTRWAGPALAAAFLAVQLFLPFRHLTYPGNVLWTEQGFRFSWNVMLMEKDGVAEFLVRDRPSGRVWVVHPKDYLMPYQAKMMSAQPDMVRDFARFLARTFQARGLAEVEVRANVFASLNGRPRQRLVDPQVDLARASAPAHAWVLPFKDVSPP